MKKVAVFSTTRAEFGIFTSLIRGIEESPDLECLLFIGGAHLAEEMGKTINEIQDSGFRITATFDYLLNTSDDGGLARSLGIATIELSRIFEDFAFDFVVILGDRYELLAIVSNAILFKKPIVHLHGGEKTEGHIDEQIRHMITKAAHIHFVICDEYADNIRNMGESEWRIYNTGALTIDNIQTVRKIDKNELFARLDLDPGKETILLSYHPTTLEFNYTHREQIENVFRSLENFNFQIVITAPNADMDRDVIHEFLQDKALNNPDYKYINSLGYLNYFNLLPHCKFVIGNSSSGIIEAPYFKIPTVNIGIRQNGRIAHESIIYTECAAESITAGIDKASGSEIKEILKGMEYKFGDGKAAQKMVEVLEKTEPGSKLMIKQLSFPSE